jgi:hypothetical protein
MLEGTNGETKDRCLLVGEQVRQTDVIRDEGSDDAESTSSLSQVDVTGEFTRSKECECDGEQTEESDKGYALSQSCDARSREKDRILRSGSWSRRRMEAAFVQEQESDDGPSSEVDTQRARELLGILSVRSSGTGAWVEDSSIGEPEGSVRRKCGSTESVTLGELPHSSEKLSKTTTEDGHSNDRVRVMDSSGLEVVQRQDESGGCKREETKRSRTS